MTLRKRIKNDGLAALRSNWGKAICMLLMFFASVVLLALLDGIFSLMFHTGGYYDIYQTPHNFIDDVPVLTPASISITAGVTFLALIILVPLFFGSLRWYYCLIGNDSLEVTSIFYYFGDLRTHLKTIGLVLSLFFRCLGWGLICFGPGGGLLGFSVFAMNQKHALTSGDMIFTTMGVVVGSILLIVGLIFFVSISLRYFAAPFLLVDDPSCSIRSMVRRSITFTKGFRRDIFLFYVSFIPWALIGLLVIPILFVAPYVQASTAILAKFIVETGKSKEKAMQEPA